MQDDGRARIPLIANAMALAAWCFLIFRGAWIDLARADHLALLEERALFPTRLAYAWHLLGYQHTRILSGEGLSLLSRPFFDAWHALLEGLLEVDALTRGLVGIGVHAAVVIAVFVLARRWLPTWLAAFAALAIATPFPGVDLVAWRHITPYAWALGFVVLAANELGAEEPSVGRTTLWLVMAALAHEAMVGVLLVVPFLKTSLPRNAWVVPLGIYAVVVFAEAVAFPVAPSVAGTGASLAGIAAFPRVFGWAVLAWVAPWSFGLSLEPWERAAVLPPAVPEMAVLLLGIAALGAVAAFLLVLGRSDGPRRTVGVLVVGYLLASVFLFSVGRAGTRGVSYLWSAGYYLQIWAVCLQILAVLWVRRRRGFLLLAIFSLVSGIPSAILVRKALATGNDFAWEVRDLDRAIVAALDAHPDTCFAGLADGAIRDRFPPVTPFAVLGRRVCSSHPELERVVLARREGVVALVPLTTKSGGAVSVRLPSGMLRTESPDFGVALHGSELHVARYGKEIAAQTDVVPAMGGAHEIGLAIVAGRVRATFDGMLGADLGFASTLGVIATATTLEGVPVGEVAWGDSVGLDWDRSIPLTF